MRSCDEILELISAALDGALSDEEQAALDEHLSRCPACSALFAELRGLHTAAWELEEVPAPDGFADQVMARIAAEPAQERPDNVIPFPAKKRARIPWKRWTATAAVAAVVILGAATLPGQLWSGSKSSDASAGNGAAFFITADQAESAEGLDNGADLYAPTSNESGFADDGLAPQMNANSALLDDGDQSTDPKDSASEEATSDGARTNEQSPPADPSAACCGVLTLTGGPLPEGLEEYEPTEDESGSLTYVVPADFLFACLAQLEKQDATVFTYAASGAETGGYGLIIVETFS